MALICNTVFVDDRSIVPSAGRSINSFERSLKRNVRDTTSDCFLRIRGQVSHCSGSLTAVASSSVCSACQNARSRPRIRQTGSSWGHCRNEGISCPKPGEDDIESGAFLHRKGDTRGRRRGRPHAKILCTAPTAVQSDLAADTLLREERSKPPRRCECFNLSHELVPYVDAWRWQRAAVEARAAALQEGRPLPDTLLLLQHPPVFTLGTRSTLANLKFDAASPPAELHRTERGGEVTYHGPGQLVMYPILDLRHQRQDLHWYLRSLEEALIRTLRATCDIRAERVEGLTGVWADGCKVAAIGVRVSRWITYHGLALNVTTDLAPFNQIVPCGLHLPVGSVAQLLGYPQVTSGESMGGMGGDRYSLPLNQKEHSRLAADSLGVCTSPIVVDPGWQDRLMELVSRHMLEEFADIFNLDLVPPSVPGPQPVAAQNRR